MSIGDAAMAARVRTAAAQVIADYRIPGLSIGIVEGDSLVFCEGFGFADLESREPMTPERRQRIASITKTMVGLCAMALVDEGKLGLHDRVSSLLPEVVFHGPAEDMTIWHLLTHTSGIGEAPTLDRLAEAAHPNRETVRMPGDFSSLYPDGIVVEVEPGTKYAYSNNGYGLLGEIVARSEGATLQDVMQSRIWAPLGMTQTDILDQNDDRITSCYHRAPNEDNLFQFARAGIPVKEEATVDGLNIRGSFTADFNQGMRAAGGVQSTVPDMAKYASALLRRAAGIVTEESFDQMTSAQFGSDSRMVTWGLSIARTPLRVMGESPTRWRPVLGHGGAYFGGWNSHLDVIPDLGIGVIQHMNIMMDEPAPIFRKIIRAVVGADAPSHTPTPIAPEILDSAPGLYELSMPGPLTNFRPQTRVGRIEVSREGDSLELKSRWGNGKTGVELTPCDPDDQAFFAIQRAGADPAYVCFAQDDGGMVVGLAIDELIRMTKRT